MSKLAGRCVFCGEPGLTKGHIWPDSFGRILPSDAEYHEQKIGTFDTFESDIPGPAKWEKVGTGSLSAKKPRNTCAKCNGGWMSQIESLSLHGVRPLILGERSLHDTLDQRQLAAVFALISMRIEFTAHGMRTIQDSDIQFLRSNLHPNWNWMAWIARYSGSDVRNYSYRYTAMQIASAPTEVFGPEYCNTQVTTLIVGQLYVHVMSSSVWPNFGGYGNAPMSQIWPTTVPFIEAHSLPSIREDEAIELHESIARLGKRAPS